MLIIWKNALAACAIAYFGGIEPSVIADVLRSFKGVEHRIELCGVIDDIRFVNDSKGTNPDASINGYRSDEEQYNTDSRWL